MPRFIFNKLVRDKLIKEFERSGQGVIHRHVTAADHIKALKQKIAEEASEIPINGNRDDLVSEIADVQQAIDDLKALCEITNDQVTEVQQVKFSNKGGFLSGDFVETLELRDDDEWVEYYRAHPNVFPEIKDSVSLANVKSGVEPGVYQHYKGNDYQVIAIGKHTETGEVIVVYRPLYESDVQYWLRPMTMFTETVTVDGKVIPRFKKKD